MRRIVFLMFAVAFLGTVIGCRGRHGVCDCLTDDHCSSRASWVKDAPPVVTEAAPGKLPEGKKKDL